MTAFHERRAADLHRRQLADGLTDQDIDRELLSIDQADRYLVWEHLYALRDVRREAVGEATVGPTLQEIEAERRKLAARGRPHGYDALGGTGYGHPFPGQRSTIVRRYSGLEPPGSWIVGVCDTAPKHQHPTKRAPGTP